MIDLEKNIGGYTKGLKFAPLMPRTIIILAIFNDNIFYSLRSIILFASIDVSRHILAIDTSVLVKSNMGRRE
jgi:hypothetical protein